MLQLKLIMPQKLIIFQIFGFFWIFLEFLEFFGFFLKFFDFGIFRNFSEFFGIFGIFRKLVRFARPPEDYSPIVLRAPNIFLVVHYLGRGELMNTFHRKLAPLKNMRLPGSVPH